MYLFIFKALQKGIRESEEHLKIFSYVIVWANGHTRF